MMKGATMGMFMAAATLVTEGLDLIAQAKTSKISTAASKGAHYCER